MKIDWFTTAAQIVNFLILVWLLKKFLYAPVLNAMARRQQRIADQLEKARERESLALREKARYLALQKEVALQARQEFEKARFDADRLRNDLYAEIKDEIEAARSQWKDTLAREQERFIEQTSRLVTKQFEQLAAASFKALADKNLEETIIDTFWQKIRTGAPQSLAAVRTRVGMGEPVTITTAFPLSASLQERLAGHCRTVFKAEEKIFFECNESLIAGITLEAGGKKISWDILHYLKDFTAVLSRHLEKEITG